MDGAAGGYKLAELFVELGTKGFAGVESQMSAVRASFRGLPTALGKDFDTAMKSARASVSGASAMFAGLGRSAKALGPAFTGIGMAAKGALIELGGGPMLNTIASKYATLAGGIQMRIGKVQGSINLLKSVASAWAGDAGDAIKSKLGGALDWTGNKFAPLTSKAKAAFKPIGDSASTVFRGVAMLTAPMMQALGPGLQKVVASSRVVIQGLGGAFTGAWSAARGGISALGSVGTAAGRVGIALSKASAASIGAGFQKMFSVARSAASGFATGASAAMRGFTSSVGMAVSAVKGAASSMGSAFSSILQSIHPLRLALVGIAGIAASGIGMITAAAGMEKLEVAFKTLTGSAENAKALLGQLTQFAAETPFEMPELAGAMKKLLAFGESQEQVVGTLRRLGDVASLIDAPIGEIAEIYGKARVQGRLFAEDVNQLTGRGIPVIQEFAKQFGVTDNEVKKLVEDGQISFRNLEQAMVSLTSKGGKFHNGMRDQSQTVAGMFSTLMDNVKGVARDLGGAMFPAVKAVMDAFVGMTGGASDSLGPLKAKITAVSTAIAAYVPTVVGWLKEGMTYVSAFGQVIGAELGAIFRIVGRLGSAIGEMIPNVSGFGGAFLIAAQQAVFFFDNLETYFALGIEQVKLWASNAVIYIGNFANNAVNYVTWFFTNFSKIWLSLADVVLTVMANIGENIREGFTAAWEFIKSGGTSGFNFVGKGLMDGTEQALERIKQTMPEAMKAAVDATTPEIERLKKKLGEAWDKEEQQRAKALADEQKAKQEREQAASIGGKPAQEGGEQAGAGDFTPKPKEGKESSSSTHSLEDFAKFLQSGINSKDAQKDKVTQKMGNNIERIATGQAELKVRVVNSGIEARYAA